MNVSPVIHIAPRHEFVILDRDAIGEDQLEAVDLTAVSDFMTRHGWVPVNDPRPGRYSYFHPEHLDDSGEPLRQYVVWGETGIHHLDTVARLLASLSIAHDLSPCEVLSELTANAPAPAGV